MTEEQNTNVMEEYPPQPEEIQPKVIAPVQVSQPVVAPIQQPVAPALLAPAIAPAPLIDTPLIKPMKANKGFWDKAWNRNKLKNPDAVAVLFLHEKRMAEPMILRPVKGFFNIKGKSYHERDDCTYTLKGKDRYPLAIIKEWSITPVGTEDWDEKEVQEKVALFQDHAIKGIRHAERVRLGERNEMQLNGKAVVGFIILAVIAGAFLISYI